MLSDRVAEKLGAKAGDKVKLGVERFSDLPRSSSLAKRDGRRCDRDGRRSRSRRCCRADASGERLQPDAEPGRAAERVRPAPHALATRRPGDCRARRRTHCSRRGATSDELNAALRAQLQPEDYGLKFREIDRAAATSASSRTELILPDATR